MECDLEDIDEEEDDWMDTRWADPGSDTVGDHGKGGKAQLHHHKSLSETGCTSTAMQDKQTAGTSAGGDEVMLTRMQLNDNKAGMEGLDKEKINQIIYEASKGSKYFENEKKREEQVQRRINEQRAKQEKITELQLKQGLEEADKLLQELEESRDLTHTIVHIDMDAYYAAVEMRDDPSLRNKPMAVGGSHMLSTSNYLARKFGVRAAMPGFIGKKLCPDLVLVKANYKQYTVVSQQIRQILAQYDPNFCPMSLDEAYLDITEHLKKREHLIDAQRSYLLRSCDEWETTLCLCDLNEVLRPVSRTKAEHETEGTEGNSVASNCCDLEALIKKPKGSGMRPQLEGSDVMTDGVQDSAKCVCDVCGKPFPPYTMEVFGKTVEEAVREMRCRIQQKTRLTASAGIAPNTMLAKVCSDRNKPNGQYRIHPDRQEVMDFIQNLPIRKIPGIGKVSETMLRALGVVKCWDLYEKRDLLFHLYSTIAFHHFMRICLAIGSTTVERDGERKSISTERTFSELSRPSDLYKKCSDLCVALVEDLAEEELRGKTVSIKIKTVKFEVKTRAHTLQHHTAEFDDIFTAARELLRVEIQAVQPQPLRLRLMGVRMSNLLHQSQCEAKHQDTITGLFKKMAERSPQKTPQVTSACSQFETDLPELPSMELITSDSRDDHPVVVEKKDTEPTLQNIYIPAPQETTGSKSTAKLKPQKKGRNNNKSVKSLFKKKTEVTNTEGKPGMKEINNNIEMSSQSAPEVKHNIDSKNITVKGKRKGGRKKTKSSVSGDAISNSLNMVTESEESSGYESSKLQEGNQSVVARQHEISMKKDSLVEYEGVPGNGGEKGAGIPGNGRSRGAGSSDGSHESHEVQKMKLFQCPVCQTEVECKNLNYFNDHVDVCLFRQISSQDPTPNNQAATELSEESVDTSSVREDKNKKYFTPVKNHEDNGQKDSEQRLESIQSLKKCISKQSVPTQPTHALESTKAHQTHRQCENAQSSKSSLSKGILEKLQDSEPCSQVCGQAPDDSPSEQIEEMEFYACPVCNVEKIGCSLEEFNEHVDSCLSRRAIKQILEEQKKLSPLSNKRPSTSSSPSQPPPAKRKKQDPGSKMKTIDSFFKP